VKIGRDIDLSRFKETLRKHAGKRELFVQIQTADGKKVSLKVNGELGVRVSRDFLNDMESLLGPGAVQLGGDGKRRMKRLEQQRLFKEPATPADEPPLEGPSDVEIDAE